MSTVKGTDVTNAHAKYRYAENGLISTTTGEVVRQQGMESAITRLNTIVATSTKTATEKTTSISVSNSTPNNNVSTGATDIIGGSVGTMDNNKASEKLLATKNVGKKQLVLDDESTNYAKSIYHSNNMFSERERKEGIFNKTYRFGYFNTNTMSAGREFLFFTKPDLNIVKDGGGTLLSHFESVPFWVNLLKDKPHVIESLQFSSHIFANTTAGDGYDEASDIFNHLLQNQVVSSLDIPSLSAQMTETAANDYGVSYSYRGSSEGSDDNPDFSLEFKDNKWLDTYMYFKAYEVYETMKHHGQVIPKMEYVTDRIIHDAFSIYKFIVAEDLETIVYYGKMYGVTPKSLPRDAFSNATFDNGITYNIDFQAAFYEDMIPDIIGDFNALSYNYYASQPYRIDIYNERLGISDGRPARAAIVVREDSNLSPAGYVYKLKWRGDDTV